MRDPLDFDDAGADDDEPAKGITIGDVRAWHDEMQSMRAALTAMIQTAETMTAEAIVDQHPGLAPVRAWLRRND
jgi:hypothetical protein